MWLFCEILTMVISITAEDSPGLNLFVAVNGNDEWSGKLPDPNTGKTDGPFATLEHARDEIRKMKSSGRLSNGANVFVRGGMYYLKKTFTLGPEDSGTPDAPIVFRAYQNEKPVLVGGKQITGFVPYKGNILKADTKSQGFDGIYFRQLFFQGKRQHLARYPNYDPENPYGGGWAYADGEFIPMYKDIPGESRRSLHYKASDAREWANPEEGEVFVFPRYNWWNNIVGIESIDKDKRIMNLKADCSYPIRPGDRYYVKNIFEELDAPGEWYLDKQTGTLYFWPP
ncbi:hypothetical protein FJZ33_06705, partial [Candidatus Poribacteria bacterium]|nr:hypothetical protein [Candidatus Poribacteria bacterium]